MPFRDGCRCQLQVMESEAETVVKEVEDEKVVVAKLTLVRLLSPSLHSAPAVSQFAQQQTMAYVH